ncbi:tetratricopeptide repeat protein [Amaricoccus tamworthensis]|uniref:tetratricopeptide repeat protein n=1 Tax=Amaricoccus tamworthensis TaxID=57002 RepID=UPI003C7A5A99
MPKTLANLTRAAFLAVALTAGAAPASALNLSGAYLAAMQADFRDDYAPAAEYYERALRKDPENAGLLQNSVVMLAAMGRIGDAREQADRLSELMPENQVAILVRLSDAIANKDFEGALEILNASGNTVNPLLEGLLEGWIHAGMGDFTAAQEQFDSMTASDALEAYGQYHKALVLALAGDFNSADRIMDGDANGPLHLNRSSLLAHAQVMAQVGQTEEAIAVLDGALANGVPDAALVSLRDRLASGEEVVFTHITSAARGAAEAYLTLAEAMDGRESSRVSLIHAQLAAHIDPDLTEARMLSAELLEEQGQFELAGAALAEIPATSPWFVTSQIRRATIENSAGNIDRGIEVLEELAATEPDRVEVHSALGDALRSAERYEEAVTAYTDAIDLVENPVRSHWVIFYTRGISNERADDWPAAKADFRKALELEPNQPLVLNYLGYSMVEEGEELDEALELIEAAVAARPDDGYITDSLGWVLYRLGRIEEAVPHMLRAVELTPDDPIINDHLGDVLWKAGRKREAEFQWRRALSFGPAEDLDMDRVRKKIEMGLDRVIEEYGSGTDL